MNAKTLVRQDVLKRIKEIPIFDTLSFQIEELASGVCKAKVPRDKKYDGIFESFHGGLLMTIADSVAAFAILSATGPDKKITTTDMNIRFLGPCRSDATAEAKIIKLGKTLSPVAVELFDENHKMVAVAQVN
jgi:uncharacterized protein (TIGR00369 family)